MPFVSQKQRAWAYTKAGTKALGGKKAVAEWEKATVYSMQIKEVIRWQEC